MASRQTDREADTREARQTDRERRERETGRHRDKRNTEDIKR